MADTWASFYAAYTITPIIFAAYVFSIWRRAKTVREKAARLKAGSSLRSE
jgi:hypothetical protein